MSDELTPQQQHDQSVIQFLRERRQSLRAQLETLETLEARKTALVSSLEAVQSHLTALGWTDPPPPEAETAAVGS